MRRPLLVCAAAAALAACGTSKASSPPSSAPTPSAPTSSTTAVPAPTSSTTPSPQAAVGLTVTGAGATLVAPAAPTTKPYTPSCQALVDSGFSAQCVILATPTGTIAALAERRPAGAPGGGGHDEQRDLVYAKTGTTWQLALRRVTTADETESSLVGSDVQRDGDPKAVFSLPAGNPEYIGELDVVEANGTVSLERQLHGGTATVAAGGGLETFTPSAPPAQGYDDAVFRYAAGSWKVTSVTQVSQTQALGATQKGGGFVDPQGTQPTFFQA